MTVADDLATIRKWYLDPQQRAALDRVEAEINEMRAVIRDHHAELATVGGGPCVLLAEDSGGDPIVVRPPDSLAESQAGLNGPSGSPTSPPGRDCERLLEDEIDGAA